MLQHGWTLRDILQHETGQSQKDKYCVIALTWVLSLVKIIKTVLWWLLGRMGGDCLTGLELGGMVVMLHNNVNIFTTELWT